MNAADIFPVVAATWPPAETRRVGPFIVPSQDKGGNRVSAARLVEPGQKGTSDAELTEAENAMNAQGRAPLFQVLDHQDGLNDALEARGYIARDHTNILVAKAAVLAETPPPVTAFDIWPPLAIQSEIWEAGGIDAARRAVMDRAACPKTSIFGRIMDQPAGSAYIGIHRGVAMLHALEVGEAFRRKGLAVHMMRAAAKWAENNGAEWFSVLVTRQNAAAQGLYASLGLKPVGTYHYRELKG